MASAREMVVVKNNGLTSFVPPCFAWDIIEDKGERKIATASELDLSELKLAPADEQDLRDSLYRGELRVKGRLEKVGVAMPSGEEGLSFVVEEVVGPADSGM
jgi:hypothetical protein